MVQHMRAQAEQLHKCECFRVGRVEVAEMPMLSERMMAKAVT